MSSANKDRRFKWVYGDGGETFYDVGILADGTLHNPRGYPSSRVRTAVEGALASRRARASEAAKRAAKTRRRRRDKKVYEAATRMRLGERLGPRHTCMICGRGLSDADSIERAIGSECWQDVLKALTRGSSWRWSCRRPPPRDRRRGARPDRPGTGRAHPRRGGASPMTDPLLTAEQVAELIGMTPDYVYALSRRGRIPTITFGRTRRYRREAIERWLAELERGRVGAGNGSGRAVR